MPTGSAGGLCCIRFSSCWLVLPWLPCNVANQRQDQAVAKVTATATATAALTAPANDHSLRGRLLPLTAPNPPHRRPPHVCRPACSRIRSRGTRAWHRRELGPRVVAPAAIVGARQRRHRRLRLRVRGRGRGRRRAGNCSCADTECNERAVAPSRNATALRTTLRAAPRRFQHSTAAVLVPALTERPRQAL